MSHADRTAAPAGSWASPISADLIVAGSKRLAEPRIEPGGVYWLEGRPEEKGRVVLVHRDAAGRRRDLTPAPYSVRSKAHEYGGGVYAVDGRRAFFVNASDQRIYAAGDGVCRPVVAESDRRYADLLLDAPRERLICISEDHGVEGEPVTTLIAVHWRDGRIDTLAAGADFYSSPTLSPDGRRLAWLSWSHPDMPWDRTTLWQAELDAAGRPVAPVAVADGEASRFQPRFGPDGHLYFVSDEDGWWNLYRHDGAGVQRIVQAEREFAFPQWVFGMSTYAFLDADTIAAISSADGSWALHTIDVASGALREVPGFERTAISQLHAHDGRIAVLAGGPAEPLAALCVTPVADGPAHIDVLARSSALEIASRDLSVPRPMTFLAGTAQACHGFYYAPANARFALPDGEAPPVLVKCHGGPTAATSTALDPRIQFWTSRGIAVLDLNYRGSTGYGRDYRQALYGRWGLADVEDCVNAVTELAARGLADPARCLISGGSAGGYTVLCALTFTEAFAAGASHYGIGDLELLARDTHKFESRYLDRIVGPWPEARETYRARSPIHHVERMRCPVIFFQGLEDKVVPPNQAETMVAALRDNGVRVAYVPFEGEGHGFRNADNIRYSLDAELSFYAHVLGFVPAGGALDLGDVLFDPDNEGDRR